MGRGGANQVDEERFSRTCPYLSGCNGNCGARRRARTRDFVVVRASITPRPSPDPFAVHRDRPSGGFFEPAPTAAVLHEGLPSGQNALLRAGIAKEIEGVTLVSTRHSAPQFPLHPYTLRHQPGEPSWKKADYSNLDRRPARMPVCGPGSGRNRRRAAGLYAPYPPQFPLRPYRGHLAEGSPNNGIRVQDG